MGPAETICRRQILCSLQELPWLSERGRWRHGDRPEEAKVVRWIYPYVPGGHCTHGDRQTPHLYEVLLIGAFPEIIQILYDNYPQVQDNCLATVNCHCKYPIHPEDMPLWLPTGYPSQEERALWHILIPKVVVHSNGTLVFHIIGGTEIPYVMQETSPLRRKPLSPGKKTVVIETYNNGVPSGILAKRYECSPAAIRSIVRRANNAAHKSHQFTCQNCSNSLNLP